MVVRFVVYCVCGVAFIVYLVVSCRVLCCYCAC